MDRALQGVVGFGAFELDTRAGELRKGRKPLHLQPQPFKVLSLLVSRAGQLVTREELQSHLWAGDTFVDFEQGLNVCIRQIRAVLHDRADDPRFLQTVPRRGYRFIARNIKIDPHPRLRFASRIIDSLAVLPFETCSGDTDIEY
jgi:DNA-binding winged helix-turn-helix (wHTH) protein